MRCSEIVTRLELLSPPSFAEKWDNVGLLVGRLDQEIASVYIALDVTDKVIEEAIEAHNPDIVISVGQAGGRFDITPERVAINIDDFRIKDNEGNQPTDEIIQEDGQAAYFSNLPVKAMVKHMNDNNIPATLSNTAGTFVCNHVMYGILYMIDKKYPNIKGGFIHIPYMTSQVMDKKNTPFMSLDEIVKGLELALEACTLYNEDIKTIGGEIC